jgi:hypothetical protein
MTTETAEAPEPYKLLVTFPPELAARLKAAAERSGRPRTRLVVDACLATGWGREPARRPRGLADEQALAAPIAEGIRRAGGAPDDSL